MSLYNLIEYIDNYSKTSGRLWKYLRYELHDTALVTSESFKFKIRKTRKFPAAANAEYVEIATP